MSKKLKRRPAGHDYQGELLKRFKVSHLCNMDYLGGSGGDRRPYQVAEGIAIIDISGVLCNDAWYYDETEYSQIQKEVRMAVDDSAVRGILLRINSCGGETDNAFETAAVLAQCAKKKPMWAVADGMAYSAAFLMAVTASKVYIRPQTGGVGSVGVFTIHFDYSEAFKQAGVKVTLLSAGKGKTDGNPYEPLADSARKQITGEINRLYSLFISNVALGRSLSPEQIQQIGAVPKCGADEAIAVGFADAGGTLEEAWFELASQVEKLSSNMASAMNSTHKEVPQMAGTSTTQADATKANPPVETPDAAANKVADLDKAKLEGYADAGEVLDLCLIAGKSINEAHAFIGKRASAADVRKALAEDRVKAAGQELNTKVLPGEGTEKDKAAEQKPAKSAAQRMAEKFGVSKGAK